MVRLSVLRWAALAITLAVLGSAPPSARLHAQPRLTITRVVNNWPSIEATFSLHCDGKRTFVHNASLFRVSENGNDIGDFTLWCPEVSGLRCSISAALVFDASISMTGQGNDAAKGAGHAFVEEMDGVIDEAAVIWFNSSVLVRQHLTVAKDSLHDAIDSLPILPASAVWDGVYAGLEELIASGRNPCRAVIVMTDGEDNSSTRTIQEIVALALVDSIPVYTIGVGTNINSGILDYLAQNTGGEYFENPKADKLVQIYEEISTILLHGKQECTISYQASCMDGTQRAVDISIRNFCGATATGRFWYIAPLDTSTFMPVKLAIGSRTIRGGGETAVQVELADSTVNEIFNAASFTIRYDDGCLQYKRVEAPPGSLLNGIPFLVTPVQGGITITTTESMRLPSHPVPASLLVVYFTAIDPEGRDTICCPVSLERWKFMSGCLKPDLSDGEVCIVPRRPELHCSIISPPQLIWSRTQRDYLPNPFVVSMSVSNSGDREARNARFTISYRKPDLALVSPMTDNQAGSPSTVMPGGASSAWWEMKAARRRSDDSLDVCITASFDNHPDVVCCGRIWIPAMDASLACDASAPVISVDRAQLKYTPMPFTVLVSALNEGGKITDTTVATIIVPPDLKLYGPDGPDRHTKRLFPSVLAPGQRGSASWTLWHPITLVEKEYLVGFWVKTSNADSSYCQLRLYVPALDAPILSPACAVPDSLHFDEAAGAYTPNPFDISLRCVNKAGLPATNVTAFVYLPDGVVFADSTEQARKTFSPSTMTEYKGGPMPTVSWRVRYTRKPRIESGLDFRFVVGGMGPTAIPTDSVETWCRVRVPGLSPSFACSLAMPDSLPVNPEGSDVQPNPFPVRYSIWNTSSRPARIGTIELRFPPADGITLDPATPRIQTLNRTLLPGDTASAIWTMHVENRTTRRLISLSVDAFDDEGNPAIGPLNCARTLTIANLKTELACSAEPSDRVIAYLPVTQEYTPTRWTVSADLVNTGTTPVSNVQARIVLEDSSLARYVEFDPVYPGNDNPKTLLALFPRSPRRFTWGFRLASDNMTDSVVTLRFRIFHRVGASPFVPGCVAEIAIEPVVRPGLACALDAPDTIRFVGDGYQPSPFFLRISLRNFSQSNAVNVHAHVLHDPRFNIVPGRTSAFGTIPAGWTVDFYDAGNQPFLLKVNPRQTDGFDTVRVLITADGFPNTVCTYPIFVMHEQHPLLRMWCHAQPARLVFDDQRNDYVPNPFTVTTTVINEGDAASRNARILFIGPPRFMPADSTPIVDIGTGGVLLPFDTASHAWRVIPLPRQTGGTDTLVFQVIAEGGLGNRLVSDLCRVPVYVPAARAPEYRVECSAPASLSFDEKESAYTPDPFPFTVRVTNIGPADGKNLAITAALSPGLILAPGESAVKSIASLAKGDRIDLAWKVRPLLNEEPSGLTRELCARVTDALGREAECCTDVFVPSGRGSAMALTCGTEFDTLTVDVPRGVYRNNPFHVTAIVTNTSDRAIENVTVVALPRSSEIRILGDQERFVTRRLEPQSSTDTISWAVEALPRDRAGMLDIEFVVTADKATSRLCGTGIYVPLLPRPKLACSTSSSMHCTNDTLYFDYTMGDYSDCSGTMSSTGAYRVFAIEATLDNSGDAEALNTSVTLLLPEDMSLDAGETATKMTGTVPGHGQSTVRWRVRPVRHKEDIARTFVVEMNADNAPQRYCSRNIVVKGAPRFATVRLPSDRVAQFGQKIIVPVRIEPASPMEFFVYRLNIGFNETLLRFIGAAAQDAITESGWNGTRATLHAARGETRKNILRIENSTPGTPIRLKSAGVIVQLEFEVLFGGLGDQMSVQTDSLRFIPSFTSATGIELYSSVNSADEADHTDVALNFVDGIITVAGDCIMPLISSDRTGQLKVRPNPFGDGSLSAGGPVVIEYFLERETDVTLTVHDHLGHPVATLVQSRQKTGRYSASFDWNGLPAGSYFCRLVTPESISSARMILLR